MLLAMKWQVALGVLRMREANRSPSDFIEAEIEADNEKAARAVIRICGIVLMAGVFVIGAALYA